jgi:hypothetical protein
MALLQSYDEFSFGGHLEFFRHFKFCGRAANIS